MHGRGLGISSIYTGHCSPTWLLRERVIPIYGHMTPHQVAYVCAIGLWRCWHRNTSEHVADAGPVGHGGSSRAVAGTQGCWTVSLQSLLQLGSVRYLLSLFHLYVTFNIHMLLSSSEISFLLSLFLGLVSWLPRCCAPVPAAAWRQATVAGFKLPILGNREARL